MLKTLAFLLALALASQAPSTPPAATATAALADEMVAAFKRHVPELGTYLGLPDAEHGRLSDNSLAARDTRRAEEDQFVKKLGAIDENALVGRPEWVIHGFLREALDTSIGNRVCEAELWNVDQMGGWQASYGQLAQIQPIDTDALQTQAIARFRGIPRYADNEIANLREGLKRGYAAPRGNVEQVITQMDGFAADSSPYYGPAERTKSQPFAAAWRDMVRKELVPAFRRYQAFLRDEYLPRARQTVAVSDLPNGRACYDARLRDMTSMAVTADQVHKTGLEELERIKTAERAIAERLFQTSDLDAAFARLEQPQYKWDTRDAVIAQARKAAERAAAAMPQWFGRLPKAKVIVTPIPLVEEPTAADRYQAGTIDGTRPGEYQINAGKWIGNRKADLEAVVFHETVPGHHLEVTLSRERADAHLITKIISTAAFSEGWGLYAERLADEMKLYSSDLDLLGMWQSRAYRAARLVVDTGLHAFGWPRQKAIDFMKALHLGTDAEITSEVDRYIIWPGQATAYMTGALEIERLRAEAKQRLGDRFEIKRFHDAVLQDGSLPLPMLRQKLQGGRSR
jgi:uncharacterized protein (DUF885 family)